MAGGMDLGGGGKGGKKSLDTAINLVPFIDLMAVTISFLIMTAVWNQITRLTVTQTGGPTSGENKPPSNTLPITLMVTNGGFTLSAGASTMKLDKVNSQYVFCYRGSDKIDEKCEEGSLLSALRKIKVDVPDQRNITVQVEDGIKYSDLVKVIDICNTKSAEGEAIFPDVAISAVG